MRIIHINLKDFYPNDLDKDVYLDGLIYDKNWELNFNRDAVLILPGGGYEFLSYREKEPIMFAFLAQGFNTFALNYSTKSAYPIPHIEVACAMDYLNTHGEEFNINECRTSIIGFSAGGHLASSYGYIYKELAENNDELKTLKPYSIILGYPVTTMKKGNETSVFNITNKQRKKLSKMEVLNHISSDYPPTFVFTTRTDKCVNYKNTVSLVTRLKKQGVKHSCIIYPSGPHGFALANEATTDKKELKNDKVSQWVTLAAKFIRSL